MAPRKTGAGMTLPPHGLRAGGTGEPVAANVHPSEMAPRPVRLVETAPTPPDAPIVTTQRFQPWVIAMARGMGEAIVLAGVTTFAMLATVSDASVRSIVIVAGGAFFTKLAAAYGLGLTDQANARRGP